MARVDPYPRGMSPRLSLLLCLFLAACSPDVRTIPFDDKVVFIESQWDGPLVDGPYLKNYESGVRRAEGHYDQGVPAGEWRHYGPDGKQRFLWTYADGLLHGPAKEWLETGELLAEGDWSEGNRVGEWTYWNTDGSKRATHVWDAGTRVSISGH